MMLTLGNKHFLCKFSQKGQSLRNDTNQFQLHLEVQRKTELRSKKAIFKI